jgi:osmotically-inducible protein OsmY
MTRELAIGLCLAVAGATGCQSTSGKTAGQAMSDASMSTAVQATLTGDRVSNFTRVDVDTERGIVTLTGVVPSADHKARAGELARQVDGVKRVNNRLQIQNEPTKTGKAE